MKEKVTSEAKILVSGRRERMEYQSAESNGVSAAQLEGVLC